MSSDRFVETAEGAPQVLGVDEQGGTTMRAHDLWLAPVRNLTWVAARYGYR